MGATGRSDGGRGRVHDLGAAGDERAAMTADDCQKLQADALLLAVDRALRTLDVLPSAGPSQQIADNGTTGEHDGDNSGGGGGPGGGSSSSGGSEGGGGGEGDGGDGDNGGDEGGGDGGSGGGDGHGRGHGGCGE